MPPPTAAEVDRVVRATFDAWNADDWEAMASFAWPDASIVAPEGWPEPGEQRGWPKIKAQFERLKEPLRDEYVEVHWIEADYPHGFSHVDWVGTGEGSGLVFRIPMWLVTTYEGLRYKRIEFYIDEEQARAGWEAVRGNG